MRMAQEVLNKPFRLNGDSIYRYRAAQVSAHRQAARGNPPQQSERLAAPTLPSADEIYRRRQLDILPRLKAGDSNSGNHATHD